ncbi:MAG: allantoinase AllB [Lachnospiraceae bacterium]
MYDLLVKNGKLVTKDRIYEAQVAIKNGTYAAILAPDEEVSAKEIIDASGKLVFPGIIDCHAHLNEPGFEYREDFFTGSRAAAVGGTTTLIDMPLNNEPALLNKEAFDLKFSLIDKKAVIDYALWGGIVNNNMNDLVDLEKCGVAAFKGFTCPNGDLFPTANLGNVREALEILKPYKSVCGFHCEEYGQVLERSKKFKQQGSGDSIRDFLDVHDIWVEYVATKNIIDMARATGGRVHICHVSHPMVAQVVKEAIAEGIPVTAETCPHYLAFSEEIVFEKGAPAKCTPPMREKEAVAKLWNYVLDGTLSCIGSDHSPAADEEKDNTQKTIWEAWGGLNVIQYFVPFMYDLIVNKKGLSPSLVAKVMGYNPAKLFGLYGKKGDFEIGFDGDIVIIDPEKEWIVTKESLYTKGHVSILEGMKGKGCAIQTIVRGKTVAKDGTYLEDAKGYGTFQTPIK